MSGNTQIENLENIAQIMTGEQIQLRYENDRAFVQLQSKPILITIPKEENVVNKTAQDPIKNSGVINLKKMATSLGFTDNYQAFDFWVRRMLLYHEMGHILYTSREHHHGKDECLHTIINFLEDARIENQLGKDFPPMVEKFEILNQIFLVQNDVAFLETASQNKSEVARKTAFLACMYHYGMIPGTPKTPLVQAYYEQEMTFRTKKKAFKDVITESQKLYDMTPGDDDEINKEMKYILDMSGNGGSGYGTGKSVKISDKLKQLMNQQLKANTQLQSQLNREIKGTEHNIRMWGMEMAHKDPRNTKTLQYSDPLLTMYLYETLKRIIGGKASCKDNNDFDGHSLDMEEYMQWEKDPSQDVKMFLTANKKKKPDMFINICIDASGSMGGDKIEVAKKTGINLSMACERVGIKTAFLKFESASEIVKEYNRFTLESKIGELGGGGGTDISSSVKICKDMMLQLPSDAKKAIILISDGEDGSASQVAEYLKAIPNVKYYMIGIASNVDGYVSSLEQQGAKVYGHANISGSENLNQVLIQFAKDFVRRSC